MYRGFGANVLGPFQVYKERSFLCKPKDCNNIGNSTVFIDRTPAYHASVHSQFSESLNKNKNTSNQMREQEMTSVLTALKYFEVFLAYF